MTSQRMEDFLGLGTSGTRPSSLDLPSVCAGFRYETDTGTWVWDGSAWVQITGTGVDGINQLTGDVTAGPGNGSQVAIIAPNAVTTGKLAAGAASNAKLADMPDGTIKANIAGTAAAPQDIDAAQLAELLAPYLPGSIFILPLAKLADYTLTPVDSATQFNNATATADIVLSLPDAAAGLWYGFAVFEPFYLKIEASGSDVISLGADSTAAGGYVRSNLPFSFITLQAHSAGRWITSSVVGAWSIDA